MTAVRKFLGVTALCVLGFARPALAAAHDCHEIFDDQAMVMAREAAIDPTVTAWLTPLLHVDSWTQLENVDGAGLTISKKTDFYSLIYHDVYTDSADLRIDIPKSLSIGHDVGKKRDNTVTVLEARFVDENSILVRVHNSSPSSSPEVTLLLENIDPVKKTVGRMRIAGRDSRGQVIAKEASNLR